MATQIAPVKDKQTVTQEGEPIRTLIKDVKIRHLNPIEDHRGEILEVYRPSWGFHDSPLVYVYQVRARPGSIRGWVVHKEQDDRLFFCTGTFLVVLFDSREDSPTHGMVNEFVFSERKPSLIIFPIGVYHAIQNIGTTEAIFINMPTKPYDHENPDKYRLPLNNDMIPYKWPNR